MPPNLRENPNDPASQAWAGRATELSYVGRTGTDSCSTAGAGGFTGCFNQIVSQARAERRAAGDVNWTRMVEEARAARAGADRRAATAGRGRGSGSGTSRESARLMAGGEQGLRRDIGFTGSAFLSFNGMVGAGIFALPGTLHSQFGAFSPWLFPIFGLLVPAHRLAVRPARRRSSRVSGGPVAYTAAFGPLVSFQAGWLYYRRARSPRSPPMPTSSRPMPRRSGRRSATMAGRAATIVAAGRRAHLRSTSSACGARSGRSTR